MRITHNLKVMDSRIAFCREHNRNNAVIRVDTLEEGEDLMEDLISRGVYDSVTFTRNWSLETGYCIDVEVWWE